MVYLYSLSTSGVTSHSIMLTLQSTNLRLNNLFVATQIHILEPQWNPSIESQAIGRLFRHGQTKTVYVTRYICRNTVEEVSPYYILS